MKCSAAHPWLLAAKTTPDLPAAVQQHLRDCLDCRLHYRRLLRLNQEVRDLPAPDDQPGVRARFWEKFEQLPARPLPLPPQRRWQGWRLVVPGVGAAAALLLLGVGLSWFRERPALTPRPEPPPLAVLQPNFAAAERTIVIQAVAHDLRLAQTLAAEERLETLTALADDLTIEAHRLARQGRMDDLAQVTGLYDRVVRHGLVEQGRALPAEQRPERVAGAVRRLREAERQARQESAAALPAVGDYLRQLAAAADHAIKALEDADPPPALLDAPRPGSAPRPQLDALVMNGLRLCAEKDPLRRADFCTDVADQLVQTILQASATGDTDQASRLGGYLGQLMDVGVARNLESAEDLEGGRLDQWEEIGVRAAKATDILERNLENAPAAARPGLQKALEASNAGRMQIEDPGKGKRKGKLPPGLEKRGHDKKKHR